MSQNNYSYTNLHIRLVEAREENYEGSAFVESTYYELIDDDENVVLKLDPKSLLF